MTTDNPFLTNEGYETEVGTAAETRVMPASVGEKPQNPSAGGFELVRLADVKAERLEWLWPDRVPLGKVTIIAGDGGLGKSMLTLDMAATVTTGFPWPDSPEVQTQAGSVILLSAEDGLADTIKPRFQAAGGDETRFHVLITSPRHDGPCVPFNLKRDLPRLEELLNQVEDVRLLIIDPVSAFTGDTDDHKNAAVRGLLAPLADLADRYKVAVVLVSHLNKNIGGKSAYRLMGSIAFFAAARAVWTLIADPENPERRLLLRSKNNLSATMTGLAFRIVNGAIRWEAEPVHLVADDAFASEGEAPRARLRAQPGCRLPPGTPGRRAGRHARGLEPGAGPRVQQEHSPPGEKEGRHYLRTFRLRCRRDRPLEARPEALSKARSNSSPGGERV